MGQTPPSGSPQQHNYSNNTKQRAASFQALLKDVAAANALCHRRNNGGEKQQQEKNEAEFIFEVHPKSERELAMPLFWRQLVTITVTNRDHTFQKTLNFKQFYRIFFVLQEVTLGESSTQQTPVTYDPDREECPICLEKKPDSLLPCTHAFCSSCLAAWNAKNDQLSCPLCRQLISELNDEAWILTEHPSTDQIYSSSEAFNAHVIKQIMDTLAGERDSQYH